MRCKNCGIANPAVYYFTGEDDDVLADSYEDVLDYACEHRDKAYYIGTLVVFKRKESNQWETIDGQQRLTTLTLLMAHLKNNTTLDFDWFRKCPMHFESRPHSSDTLQAIFEYQSMICELTGMWVKPIASSMI